MDSPNGGTYDKPSVTIRCQDNASVVVTFCDRFSFDADSVHYAVELRAPGLTARVNEVVAWTWDSDLTTFWKSLLLTTGDGTANGVGGPTTET